MKIFSGCFSSQTAFHLPPLRGQCLGMFFIVCLKLKMLSSTSPLVQTLRISYSFTTRPDLNRKCRENDRYSPKNLRIHTLSRILLIVYFRKNELKGTVQRKLTGVESDINQKVFLSHWTADIYFLNFKGTCSLNSKKPVSVAKAKICGLSNSMGRPQQITDSGKPIQIHSW